MKAKIKTLLRNVENGNLNTWSEKVLSKIKDNTPTDTTFHDLSNVRVGISIIELKMQLKMAHQTLTARISELTDNGLIKCIGEVVINNTIYSNYVYVESLEYRKRLIVLRKREKFLQWLKKADSHFEFMNDETVKMICFEQENFQYEI